MALYAPEAVFIANDGRTITDRTQIAVQFQRDMSLGLSLKANVRHVFVGDDTAQIVVDWSIGWQRSRRRGCSPWGLGKRYRATRRGWILAVHLSTIIKGTAVRQPPDTTERIRLASKKHAVNTKSE